MYTSSLILFPFSSHSSTRTRPFRTLSSRGVILTPCWPFEIFRGLSGSRHAPLPAAAAHLILPPLRARCRIHTDTLRCLTDLPPSHPTARLFPLYLSRSIPFFFPSFDTIALHASFVLASAWDHAATRPSCNNNTRRSYIFPTQFSVGMVYSNNAFQ